MAIGGSLLEEMRQQERWVESNDLDELLNICSSHLSQRLYRLFACAYCRTIWEQLPQHGKESVIVAEKFADHLVAQSELWDARRFAVERGMEHFRACKTAVNAPFDNQFIIAKCHMAIIWATSPHMGDSISPYVEGVIHPTDAANVLRHIIGNPFLMDSLVNRTNNVVALAKSLYEGEDCGYALHDALEDSGAQGKLVEHFAEERNHPKGCWAVDQILCKRFCGD